MERQKLKLSRIAVERRQNLIDAAIRSIARNGYEAVTLATICDEAGFSRGLIGHYFSGKEELLLEAARSITESLGDAQRRAVAAAGPNPLMRLHAIIDASFTAAELTPEKIAIWVALIGKVHWSKSLSEIYSNLWRGYRTNIGRLFARAAEQRELQIDVEEVTLGFSQLIEGMWVGLTADPLSITPDKAAKICHSYIDMVFGRIDRRPVY
jgi:TetR/AcrR family transcriptional repressor of bet genes